jgi:hypothetical protein
MNALLAPRPQRMRSPFGFIIVAALCYLIDGAIARSSLFALRSDLFAPAISIDLTLGVTFAYWLLVVRPKHAPLRSTLPVFLASVAAAALTLPSGHRAVVQYIRYLGIPVELAVVALVIIGVRRAHRRLAAAGIEMDVPERIQTVLSQSLPYPRIADVVGTEVSLLYYALVSWRRTPFIRTDTSAFAYHRRTAYAAILYTLVFASIVEMVALHFLLRAVAPHIAVAVLALSIFGTLWLLGFVRAVQLRPILVSSSLIHVRNGLLWTADIPRDLIEHIAFGRVRAPAKGTPGYLRAAFGEPNVLVDLRAPICARGPYGTVRSVSRIGLVIDDIERFRAVVA